jgi:OFA family oxalate/formate antiporter-like MFS transporter
LKKLTEKKTARLYYGYVIVVLAFFIGAVAWGSQRTFGVFLDPLIQQFGWTRAAASLTITIQGFVTGLSAIIAGRLSDRFGPRIVLTICGVLIGTAYLLSYLIDSLFLLYILQGVVLAVGLAGIMVPLTSMVIRWFASRAGLMNSRILTPENLEMR